MEDIAALTGGQVYDKDKGGNGTYNIRLAVPELRNNENASLNSEI